MPERMPWSKWEWDRWEGEETLKQCSLAAQGLWMRLLCQASKNEGLLLINGKPPGIGAISNLVGKPVEEVLPLMQELESEGVFSRTGTGVIYNRRMARGNKRALAGRLGGLAKSRNQQTIPGLLLAESESESESPLAPQGVSAKDVEEIWRIASKVSRGRSSKEQVAEALRAAVDRGHKPAVILAGVGGYFRSKDATREGGQYAMGVHRLLQRDRWEAHVPRNVVPITEASPWPARVRGWVQNHYWNTVDWGPNPWKPDCQCPAEFLTREALARPDEETLQSAVEEG